MTYHLWLAVVMDMSIPTIFRSTRACRVPSQVCPASPELDIYFDDSPLAPDHLGAEKETAIGSRGRLSAPECGVDQTGK